MDITLFTFVLYSACLDNTQAEEMIHGKKGFLFCPYGRRCLRQSLPQGFLTLQLDPGSVFALTGCYTHLQPLYSSRSHLLCGFSADRKRGAKVNKAVVQAKVEMLLGRLGNHLQPAFIPGGSTFLAVLVPSVQSFFPLKLTFGFPLILPLVVCRVSCQGPASSVLPTACQFVIKRKSIAAAGGVPVLSSLTVTFHIITREKQYIGFEHSQLSQIQTSVYMKQTLLEVSSPMRQAQLPSARSKTNLLGHK